MNTRIVKLLNWDGNRSIYPYRYSCQKECKFLFWKYWDEFNWHYVLDSAKKSTDKFILENTKVPRGVVEVINYPGGAE